MEERQGVESEDDFEEQVPDQPQPSPITTEELVEREAEVQLEEEEELEAAIEEAEEGQQMAAAESIEEEEIAVVDPGALLLVLKTGTVHTFWGQTVASRKRPTLPVHCHRWMASSVDA